jgi:hypothetical protein
MFMDTKLKAFNLTNKCARTIIYVCPCMDSYQELRLCLARLLGTVPILVLQGHLF